MTTDVDAWVRQYAEWCADRIEEVIVGEKLHAQLLRVIRGPITITFQMRLLSQSMTQQAITRLLSLGRVMGQALQTSSVRIHESNTGSIEIEVPLSEFARKTPSARFLAQQTSGAQICIGVDSCRQPVHIDVKQHGAMLWVGPSRSGKTQSMKSTLYALLADDRNTTVRFVVFAQKLEDWESFASARGCWGIYSNASQAMKVVDWTTRELELRGREKRRRPAVIIIADDLINLLKSEPEMGEPLGAIASMGAGLGMHLFVGTQEAGSKRGTGDNSVENNVTARIVYRIANAQAASRSAGQGKLGIEALSGGKGDGLFISHGDKRRIATGYVSDDWIARLPQGDGEVAPWDQPLKLPKLPETGQNWQKPGQPAANGVSKVPHAAENSGSDIYTPVVPVAQPEPVLANFPIKRRPLDANERKAVRQMYANGMSKNRILDVVYASEEGKRGKDGTTFRWLNEALSEPDSIDSVPDVVSQPEKGQQVLRMLMDENMIDWRATGKANRR